MSTVRDLTQEKTENQKHGLSLFQSFFSTGVFGAFANSESTAIVSNGLGKFIFFPAFAGLALLKASLHLYELTKVKNKNLGKVASFAREALTFGMISTAIVGSFFAGTVLAALTPILFVSAMAMNTAYHLGSAIYNGYRALTVKNPEAAKHHRAQFKKNMIGAAIGAVVTVGVAMIMVTGIAVPAMALMSAAANAVGFAMGAVGAFKKYFAKKPQSKVKPIVTSASIELADMSPLNDYFYRKNRKQKVVDSNESKQYILSEIANKKALLQQQIAADTSIFKQTSKRNEKIAALSELEILVKNADPSVNTLAQHSIFKTPKSAVFQSFFRKKSDTQDIFTAAETYFQQARGV